MMSESHPPIQLYLLDDHQIILDGLQALLADTPDIEVMGEANSGEELLHRIQLQQPDVILLDVNMPKVDGRETARRIKEIYPAIKIIALTMHNEQGMIQAMMRAGASGYLLKNTSQEELITAIRTVYKGRPYFSGEVTESLLQQQSSSQAETSTPASLTKRELEILKLIAEGNSNTEIGEKLFISHRTVDTHRTNLMKKLEVKNIAGLIRFAFKHGLID